MKNSERSILYDKWIELVINHYGNEDVKRKIEFIENFLKENFEVDEFENSLIEMNRVHLKSYICLLLAFILDYDDMNQNSEELNGYDDSTSKITDEKLDRQKHYLSLNVEDIFPVRERTVEETQFIEKYLDKLNVDLEAEYPADYFLSRKQLVLLLSGIIKAWSDS